MKRIDLIRHLTAHRCELLREGSNHIRVREPRDAKDVDGPSASRNQRVSGAEDLQRPRSTGALRTVQHAPAGPGRRYFPPLACMMRKNTSVLSITPLNSDAPAPKADSGMSEAVCGFRHVLFPPEFCFRS